MRELYQRTSPQMAGRIKRADMGRRDAAPLHTFAAMFLMIGGPTVPLRITRRGQPALDAYRVGGYIERES